MAWNRQDGTAQPFELVAIAPDLCVARHHQRCHRIASSSRLDLARNRHQRRYRFRDSRPPAFTAGSWLLAAMYRHAETQSDALDLNVIERLMTRTSFYDHAATGLFGLLSVALADTAIGLAGPIYFPRSFQRRPSGG
ncbi:MAG TPA: hypothetical protein VKH35_15460 [Thermoanaerobaculia bacterium]|nr:hypothetical protein [Thermoanaerobaculia bacterium]